jgi:hypothetical protein
MPSQAPRLRVKIYLWFDRWLQRWVRLLGILHEGFWLGWLDSEDLAAVMPRSYERSVMYNGLEHNQTGLFAWERDAIGRFFLPGSRILVPACGGGREIVALHALGFQVDGFDCTPSLLETSRRLSQEFDIPCNIAFCPPNEIPPSLMPHSGIIIGWTAYTLIPGRDRRIGFLRKLRELLPLDAPLLVSFWVRNEASWDEGRVLRLTKWIRSSRGQGGELLELGDHLTDRGYHHYFFEEDIEAEFKAGGFRLSHYSEESFPHAVGIAE